MTNPEFVHGAGVIFVATIETQDAALVVVQPFDDVDDLRQADLLEGANDTETAAFSLHGLDVLSARAHSDEQGTAAAEFRVELTPVEPRWEAIELDLRRALAHELAIEARLEERARTYRRRRRTQAAAPGPPRVDFDDEASSNATVIVVHGTTAVGILYRITKTLAELGLDIRHATVQTIGMEVVDTFYVRTVRGALVTDPSHRVEIQRAILHVVNR